MPISRTGSHSILLSPCIVTQEFHLSITDLGSDRYLIRTEDAAAGVPVAEAQVHWPVEEWLRLAQPALDDPIRGLLQGQMDLSDRLSSLTQLGNQLYDALFQDEAIRESWLRAQGIAQNRHEILRLRLGLKESRLQRLPWEVMQHSGQPLTTRTNLTFTRYAANLLVGQVSDALQLPTASTLIKVLFVIASPRDQDHLKLIQEVSFIQELLRSETDPTVAIQIDVLEQPDRGQLAQKLEQGNYQVLHYAGHSDFSQNGGDLSLVNRQTGLTERLTGDDLAGLLVNNHVMLAIFNSCRSGHIAGDDIEMDWRQQNLVQALVQRGVPSVIAMAERIPDEVAIAFTRLFYHNLREGFPIDISLSRTRQGLISGFGSDQHYWALPILYLHPDFDGSLIERDRDANQPLHTEPLAISEPPPALPPEPPNKDVEVPQTGLPDLEDKGVTTTLLTELDHDTLPQVDEDALLASYVQQLSKGTSINDEPLMPANQDENLVTEESQRTGMAIYETLPEVPLQKVSIPHTTSSTIPQPVSARETHAKTATPQSVYSPEQSRQLAEKPLLIWLALGLVGLVGIIGLSFLAIRWAGVNSEISRPSVVENDLPIAKPQPASPAPATLIRQAEAAIAQRRFADARENLGSALTQELMGETAASAVSDAVWPLVSDTQVPELLYVKGRIAWQEIAQISSDLPEFDSRYEQRALALQAHEAWEQTEDTFLEGRIARGFADYATGDWDGAVNNWEAAIALYDEERRLLPDPTDAAAANPSIAHVYAGLVMAHTKLGNINLVALSEDERIQGATPEEQAILMAESDEQLALAREYFLRLRELDLLERMNPGELVRVTESPETWNNWLWTDSLINDWRRDYWYWDERIDGLEPVE